LLSVNVSSVIQYPPTTFSFIIAFIMF